jgi:bacteriocin-like protein
MKELSTTELATVSGAGAPTGFEPPYLDAWIRRTGGGLPGIRPPRTRPPFTRVGSAR